jgi:hypothetical protein
MTGKRASSTRGLWPAAVTENFYECASDDPGEHQVWCYTDRWSYAPGDSVQVHLSTTSPTVSLTLWRDGAVRQDVWHRDAIPGRHHPTPVDCSVRGCDWPVALTFDIAPGWRSGGYVLEISCQLSDGRLISHHHLFIVRAAAGSAATILQVVASGTWAAYNDWGGSNHYEGITGPNRNQPSPIVSIHRPLARGFVVLPEGAPRIPLRTPPKLGAALRHPHMEWAYANGYSKKYASGGWASYDRHFLCWAEAAGYAVDLCTLHDIHADPSLLDRYQLAVFVGHDEYWTGAMRDAVDAFVTRGGKVARFAGNFLWQTRLEDDGATQVCYKYTALIDDPLRTSHPSLVTTAWESQALNRPGALTFGVNALRGLYAGWGGAAPRHAGGFTVYRPEHWALAGTDLYYGDVFGADSRIFGYEVDGLAYGFRDGLPFATSEDGAPEGIDIIAMGVAVMAEENHGDRGVEPFIGQDDIAFTALALHGADTPETRAKVRYGSGMIVNFRKGAGEVFTAGTCEWVAGLIDRDPFVDRITRTVLDRFSQR